LPVLLASVFLAHLVAHDLAYGLAKKAYKL
jgi:hypothetical protein